MPLTFTRYLMRGHLYLFLILFLTTIATLISTGLTYRNSVRAANDSLELQAMGIAVSLGASLAEGIDSKRNILQDMITAGMGEGIAYAALYSGEGRILLHSNENLVGRSVRIPSVQRVASTGLPSTGYSILGTGERVFLLDFPVRTGGPLGQTAVLRLALHTYPVERIVRQARLQVMIMAAVLLILWVMGGFIVRAVKRSEELKGIMAERERLAVIGEMASVLAHEIRNPLGSIKGFAQYLREQGEAGRAQTASYMDIIISESERLESLTEDLLSYARTPETRLEEFPLDGLMDEVLRTVRQPDDRGDVEIRRSIPPGLTALTDRGRLREVLENIIQNALDAVSGGGLIEITATEEKGGLRITVRDNGCGMDGKALEKAFVPFFTTKTRGTGLGLAIVRKILGSIGGDIRMESEPGRGTTCTITLERRDR